MTRSKASDESMTDEIISFMDKKFAEIKEYINGPLLLEIKEGIKNEMKIVIDRQNEKIERCESTVALLQEHVKNLKVQNEILSSKSNKIATDCEELEQYGRRLCLRINGIPPVNEKENAGDVLKKVKDQFIAAGIKIPDNVIDRAHRIGPRFKDRETKKEAQSIIIRFTTFRHRTEVYYARKKMSIKVSLDLTKTRHSLLQNAHAFVKDNPDVKFVFVDIKNCG